MRRVVGERPHAPRTVANPCSLDFQHIGAVVRQQLGGIRTSYVVRKVQHAQV